MVAAGRREKIDFPDTPRAVRTAPQARPGCVRSADAARAPVNNPRQPCLSLRKFHEKKPKKQSIAFFLSRLVHKLRSRMNKCNLSCSCPFLLFLKIVLCCPNLQHPCEAWKGAKHCPVTDIVGNTKDITCFDMTCGQENDPCLL